MRVFSKGNTAICNLAEAILIEAEGIVVFALAEHICKCQIDIVKLALWWWSCFWMRNVLIFPSVASIMIILFLSHIKGGSALKLSVDVEWV